jgi:hypothetical protein
MLNFLWQIFPAPVAETLSLVQALTSPADAAGGGGLNVRSFLALEEHFIGDVAEHVVDADEFVRLLRQAKGSKFPSPCPPNHPAVQLFKIICGDEAEGELYCIDSGDDERSTGAKGTEKEATKGEKRRKQNEHAHGISGVPLSLVGGGTEMRGYTPQHRLFNVMLKGLALTDEEKAEVLCCNQPCVCSYLPPRSVVHYTPPATALLN